VISVCWTGALDPAGSQNTGVCRGHPTDSIYCTGSGSHKFKSTRGTVTVTASPAPTATLTAKSTALKWRGAFQADREFDQRRRRAQLGRWSGELGYKRNKENGALTTSADAYFTDSTGPGGTSAVATAPLL